MPSIRTLVLLTAFGGLGLSASAHGQTYSVAFPSNVIAGTPAAITISVVNGGVNAVTNYGGTATVAITGVAASSGPSKITFTNGNTATVPVQFMFTSTGTATLTVTDDANTLTKFSATITVSSVQSICGECFASIGVGSTLSTVHATDYSNNSNILSSNQIGNSTPQYLIGVSFQIRIHGVRYKQQKCPTSDYASANPTSTYCYPWKAFVNLKLSSESSQTLNGFTFGLSHSLTSHLDIMAGFAYSPFSEPSPGFQAAAVQVVRAEQGLTNPQGVSTPNPYYTQFDPVAMQKNSQNAFDGFPTQLINPMGIAGAAIYSGNILTTVYHPGIFLGINIPVALGSLFSGTNGGK
jgi:hypothetical protein